MIENRTILLEPGYQDICASARRMFTDLRVGGLVLRGVLDPAEVEELCDQTGQGFSMLPQFQPVYDGVGLALNASESPEVVELSRMTWGHEWHLPLYGRVPMVRVWLHLAGVARFSLSRAKDIGELSGYGMCQEQVEEYSHSLPTVFVPEPGDALVFVDRGYPTVTGTSTLHAVEAPKWRSGHDRLSVVCDVNYRI